MGLHDNVTDKLIIKFAMVLRRIHRLTKRKQHGPNEVHPQTQFFFQIKNSKNSFFLIYSIKNLSLAYNCYP